MAEEKYTKEDYANEPLSSAINPNILVGDKFKGPQLDALWMYEQASEEGLAEFDQTYFDDNGITFTEEMEHLLNSEKTKLRPPTLKFLRLSVIKVLNVNVELFSETSIGISIFFLIPLMLSAAKRIRSPFVFCSILEDSSIIFV